jgi:hypothetical protein
MKIIYAKNPQWANRSNTLINLIVKVEQFPTELPFTANAEDPEVHGRELFSNAIKGLYGGILPFEATTIPLEVVTSRIKDARNKKLIETDWTQLPDVPQTTRELWEPYRQALRDLPQQTGFPWYSQVVEETDFGYNVDVNKAPWPVKPA